MEPAAGTCPSGPNGMVGKLIETRSRWWGDLTKQYSQEPAAVDLAGFSVSI